MTLVSAGAARLRLLLALPSCLAAAPRQEGATSVPEAVLKKLRTVTTEVAKTGEGELVQRMRAALEGLGDDPGELERLARGWEKSAACAKPSRSTRASAANRLRRELRPLVASLAGMAEPARAARARWILALDSEDPEANAAAGRELDADGAWLDADERAWKHGAAHVADLAHAAARLEFEIAGGESANPALLHVAGGGHVVRAPGVVLHSRMPRENLERILRQALRAAALSQGLIHERMDLPADPKTLEFVLLDTHEQFVPALDEARAAQGIDQHEHADALRLVITTIYDARGWSTSRWRSEADFAALIAWRLIYRALGTDVQPCLIAGHVNWVCLRFLGTSKPSVVWSEVAESAPAQRTSSEREDELQRQTLWRAARQSLWGCRAWMVREVRAGRDPSWARSMLDHEGKIVDEHLLKSTLVAEFLQVEGRLAGLMEATRAVKETVPAFERALGESLPEFDARWRRWLDPQHSVGVVQELLREPPASEEAAPDEADPFGVALARLEQLRGEALAGQSSEIQQLIHEPELARAAALHARYLTLNPDQKSSWPDLHEERPDRPGFTPEGALSGSRSVIAFDGDPARALEAWLATFYHRLPLLDPGLFGVGWGQSEEVVVLDVGSLRLAPWRDHHVFWPLPGATDVPRAFRPEKPNPVPLADQSTLGYPITVQLHFAEPKERVELTLELFSGDPSSLTPVECHVISPDAPLFPELVPANAWGLIPARILAKKTRYTVRASWGERKETWSFTTGE